MLNYLANFAAPKLPSPAKTVAPKVDERAPLLSSAEPVRSNVVYANLPMPTNDSESQSRPESGLTNDGEEEQGSYALPPLPKPVQPMYAVPPTPVPATSRADHSSSSRGSSVGSDPLHKLNALDALLIKRVPQPLGSSGQQKVFSIVDRSGNQLFRAVKKKGSQLCFPSFSVTVTGGDSETELVQMHGTFSSSLCCIPCFLQFIQIDSPPGTSIGTVEQLRTLRQPRFTVKESSDKEMFTIEGPYGDLGLVICNSKQTRVGKITDKWSGLAKDAVKAGDNYFGVGFPKDFDANTKLVLLGAAMLTEQLFLDPDRT